ncbi:uncharacterized protein LOC122851119 [Aphidius gifuensis]|uniref:uncharacterized protein LOC122851119 n=1 Tax=Aphidius gifuensis TaxID=684658 RepID=UPI001CDD51C6|nr:uncharacterized protein LOC122851119 [Aphidius gifuensis]
MERSKKNNISILCAIIIACLNGVAVSAQVDNQSSTTVNSSTTINEFSTDFFILTTQDKILTRPYFSKNAPLSEIKIADSKNFTGASTIEEYNVESISDCSNKRIYILKKSTSTTDNNQYLDVIQYDDSKKFTRINRISEIFNKATSASLDWTTGNIYWIEHDKEAYRYSIKFTNKLFEEPQYIIQPAKMSMVKIQVYPKRNEIFFSDKTNIWYTSTLPNSTANLLFSSSTDDTWENLFGVFDFVIDYAHDRLWWNDVTTLCKYFLFLLLTHCQYEREN